MKRIRIRKQMTITWSKMVGLLLGACVTGQTFAQEDGRKPNIVVIIADDLGYADLGSYGNKIIKTPHIDDLARQGVSFTNAYAGASVCSPSRGTLFTGLHTGHARIRGNMTRQGGVEGLKGDQTVRRPNLLPQDSTIANVLSNNGYMTTLINKWHVDGFDTAAHPLNRGFQEFHGWLVREDRSHNHYPTIRYHNTEEHIITENLDNKRGSHATDIATDEAVEFILRKKEKPFFLLLTYNAPHTPLDVKSLDPYTDIDLPANDKAYAALITHMDEGIGRVLKAVDDAGISDNTVFIFASDNGGSREAKLSQLKQNGHLRGAKAQLYEGGLRVPLIIKMPDETNAGSTSNFPAYFPDLFSTIVDISKSKTTLQTDGISLVSEIIKPNSLNPGQRYLYWEQYPRQGIAQAVRWGDWKLIRQNTDAPYELYNLRADDAEQHNVADKHPYIVEQLSGYLKEAHVPSDLW
ncbi:sulfatase-like hydrolase/transferase [Sphingobacterium pedocola]|uniref:Sulfatase n=1 Tax=Sphingobacterium pedocola TaxID=2082722 RepID=A0ABR9T3L8_9SPHI|nr:sulfatase-like hydrolase/transferase [Sphingobacterium pedocola]MBE8719942.1 sulfatase [Sphingobacterium pedocola]